MSPVIPRNQASSAYPRLEFAQFDAPPPPPTPIEPIPEVEEIESSEADGPLEIAPGVQLPTLEEIEQIQQDAQREGYSLGYEEGSARGRMEAAELHQLVQALDGALSQLDQQVADEVQALAIEIARLVVRDTLATKPEAILAVAREALLHLPQQAATVRVNPADAELVRRFLGEHYEGIAHRVAEDADISPGGCFIESAGSQIDAQLETRWRRVVESLSPSAATYADD